MVVVVDDDVVKSSSSSGGGDLRVFSQFTSRKVVIDRCDGGGNALLLMSLLRRALCSFCTFRSNMFLLLEIVS